MKRSGPLRRRAELVRRTRLKVRRVRKPPAQSLHEATLRARFVAEKFRQGRCANCGFSDKLVFLEVHHVLAKGLLKRLLARKGEPCSPEILWDPDNALVLCSDCHERHTNRSRPLGSHVLRPENWAFAERHGLTWALEAAYPEARAA